MTHVLIVDDKEENLYYLSALLQGSGYSVSTAENGVEALEKAREEPPELVISDLLMPVMDGYTLLRNWKADAGLRSIPFVVYTATYTEQDDRTLALDMGADEFVLKPCEPDDFMEKIRSVQERAREVTASPRHPVVEEEQLYKSYSESLIRKLEDKTLELEAANRHLEAELRTRKELEEQMLRAQRMESIGSLAGGVAHDLNNLLSPILMGVGVSRQFDLPEPVRVIMQTIEDSAQRGSALVRQVLSFARGSDIESRESINLVPLLREVKSIVEKTFPRGIRFELECPEDLPQVTANSTQLSQVWLNLCVNARDAMPEYGALKVTASVANLAPDSVFESVTTGQPVAGDYLCIEFRDSGCGIPPENMKHLFDPFFSTKAPEQGTGLGLSTAASIVKSHGGFIAVESESGKGSAFKVYLPVAALAPQQSCPATAAYPPGEGECILVVDDEASIRGITCQTLESFGYKALSAEGGPEALTLFRSQRASIDLVLTDLQMPCMDGATLVRALKAIDPDVRCIVTSGEAAGPLLKDLEVEHFLEKPFSAKELLVLLRKVL